MKRLIVSALCVSFAFVGIGTIADQVAAGFKSDEKALDIIKKARVAIGGDVAIAGVRSFIIKGQSSKTFSVDGAERTELGETEIVFESPNRLFKMMKFGDHAGAGIVEKNVDVVVLGGGADGPHKMILEGKDGEFVSDDGKKVVVSRIRSADGADGEFKTEDGNKVFVRKIEGAEGASGETRVFVRKKADGEQNTEDVDVKEIATADGKKFTIVRKAAEPSEIALGEGAKRVAVARTLDGAHGKKRDNELLRTMLSLLLTAPEGMDVEYSYAGETSVEGTAANAVLASFGGSSVKLYFDSSSNLPLAMSYVGHPSMVMVKMRRADPAAAPVSDKDVVKFERKLAGPEAQIEHFVRFADYRSVNGLLLPYRWTTTVAGKQSDVFDVTSYDLNPANISERFKADHVLVRTKAKENK